MSKKEKPSAYWYFRFSDRFFDDLEILRLQRLPGNAGYEYIVILLKMYCLSTHNGGSIKIRTFYTGGIDYRLIADAIRHDDVETVKAAINYFMEVELLQVLEAVDYTTLVAPGVQNNIGMSSKEADRRRELRELEKQKAEVQEQLPIPQPQEQTLPEQSEDEKRFSYGLFRNISLTPLQLEEISKKYENADKLINELSVYKNMHPEKAETINDYDTLCKIAKSKGVLRETIDVEIPKGIFNNIVLSKKEWEKLTRIFADPRGLVDYISQRIYAEGYTFPSHYAFAMKVGREDHWMTLGEKLKLEEKRNENKAKYDAQIAAEEAALSARAAELVEKKKKELGITDSEELARTLIGQLGSKLGKKI